MTTVAALETKYQRTFAPGPELDAITAAIGFAEAEVQSYLDRFIELVPGYQEVVHVLHPDHRLFSRERIDDNLVVEERTAGGTFAPLVADDDYVVVDQTAGRIHRIFSHRAQRSWSVGYSTVRLTYDAGWSTIPPQINTVVGEIAFARWLFSHAQGAGELIAGAIVNERIGDYNIRYGDVRASTGEQSLAGAGIGISRQHQRMLAPFRRRHVA